MVRQHPLLALVAAFLAALLVSLLLVLPQPVLLPFLPYPEVAVVWSLVAFALAGYVAGRQTHILPVALVAAFLGGFLAHLLFRTVAASATGDLVLGVAYAALAGLFGWLGSLGVRRRTPPADAVFVRQRNCEACGARVGVKARRCWNCKRVLPLPGAFLTRTRSSSSDRESARR